ncbi:MAG: metallophosphoesterase [Gammaproteobacteria bacterium]|nr:metallophosphoesterase [Gammaproteobacteria bacterium]NND59620.1 hypothetical protein [Gammaproteobacteria bacterium]
MSIASVYVGDGYSMRNAGWLTAVILFAAGCEQTPLTTTATGDGQVRFAVIGDAPYQGLDFPRFRHALKEIDASTLDFVIHVGDILWFPCDEDTYQHRLDQLQRLNHAVIYTPGDNEWADCHDRTTGSYQPLERLQVLRATFFANPAQSLGARPIAVVSQSQDELYTDYVENQRWRHDDVVFSAFNMPGSWNAGSIFDGRTAADDAAAVERKEAAVAWIEQAFSRAEDSDATALVLATHADMGLTAPADDPYRSSYEPVVQRLQTLAAATSRPILLIHGDSHDLIVDQPLRHPDSGAVLSNFTRLQVMGAPDVGWVEVSIDANASAVFRFTPRHTPWWILF